MEARHSFIREPFVDGEFADKARHDKLVSLVAARRMLALHKSLSAARNPSEQDRLKREVEPSADGEIDRLVTARELYGLTEEEIKIVEG